VTDDDAEDDYVLRILTSCQTNEELKSARMNIHINVKRGNMNNAMLSSTERG
jgi:hypothetical protein